MATKKTTHSKNGKPAKKVAKSVKPVKKIVAKKSIKSKPVAKKTVKKAIKKKELPKKALDKKTVKSAKSIKKVVTKNKPVAKKTASKITKSIKPIPKAAAKQQTKTTVIKKPIIQTTIKVTKPLATKLSITTIENKKPAATVIKKPIVIPKTSVRTSVKYMPDFTKSILDTSKQSQSENMMRYSDAELAEFKELITQKLEAARKELNYLQGLITRKDEMGGDETENRYMTMEDGSMSMEREQLSQMASRQITFIDHLEKALARIENKTYGICRITGKLIDKARLRAVPHATLSMEAKMSGIKQ